MDTLELARKALAARGCDLDARFHEYRAHVPDIGTHLSSVPTSATAVSSSSSSSSSSVSLAGKLATVPNHVQLTSIPTNMSPLIDDRTYLYRAIDQITSARYVHTVEDHLSTIQPSLTSGDDADHERQHQRSPRTTTIRVSSSASASSIPNTRLPPLPKSSQYVYEQLWLRSTHSSPPNPASVIVGQHGKTMSSVPPSVTVHSPYVVDEIPTTDDNRNYHPQLNHGSSVSLPPTMNVTDHPSFHSIPTPPEQETTTTIMDQHILPSTGPATTTIPSNEHGHNLPLTPLQAVADNLVEELSFSHPVRPSTIAAVPSSAIRPGPASIYLHSPPNLHNAGPSSPASSSLVSPSSPLLSPPVIHATPPPLASSSSSAASSIVDSLSPDVPRLSSAANAWLDFIRIANHPPPNPSHPNPSSSSLSSVSQQEQKIMNDNDYEDSNVLISQMDEDNDTGHSHPHSNANDSLSMANTEEDTSNHPPLQTYYPINFTQPDQPLPSIYSNNNNSMEEEEFGQSETWHPTTVAVPPEVPSQPSDNVTVPATTDNLPKKENYPLESIASSSSSIVPSTDINFTGFKTGRNKPVTVSDKAMEHARLLMKNIDNDNNPTVHDPLSVAKPNLLSTPANSKTILPPSVVTIVANVDTGIAFTGFSTGRNKPVTISESAMSRARALMATADMNDNPSDMVTPASSSTLSRTAATDPTLSSKGGGFTGFSTGRNKPVAISESAMVRARALMASVDGNDNSHPSDLVTPASSSTLSRTVDSDPPKVAFTGFSTGRNKAVPISEAAMARARALMLSVDKTDEVSDENKGLRENTSTNVTPKPSSIVSLPFPSSVLPTTSVKKPFAGFSVKNSSSVPVNPLLSSNRLLNTAASSSTVRSATSTVNHPSTRKKEFVPPRKVTPVSATPLIHSSDANRVIPFTNDAGDPSILHRTINHSPLPYPSLSSSSPHLPSFPTTSASGRKVSVFSFPSLPPSSSRIPYRSAILNLRDPGPYPIDFDRIDGSSLQPMHPPLYLSRYGSWYTPTETVHQITATNASFVVFDLDGRPRLHKPQTVPKRYDISLFGLRGILRAAAIMQARGCSVQMDLRKNDHPTDNSSSTSSSAGCKVNLEWVANAYRWIVWKLAVTEQRGTALAKVRQAFSADNPQQYVFEGYCSWNRLIAQLLYRYEREITLQHESPLISIYRTEVPASAHMILTVANATVVSSSPASSSSAFDSSLPSASSSRVWIEFTDGWYSIAGVPLDGYIIDLVAGHRLKPGMKVRICNASFVQLSNSTVPVTNNGNTNTHSSAIATVASGFIPGTSLPTPLESTLNSDWIQHALRAYDSMGFRLDSAYSWILRTSSTTPSSSLSSPSMRYLAFSYNCIRPAVWSSKLGFGSKPYFLTSLISVKNGGGPVPGLRVILGRRYQPRVLLTLPDNTKTSMDIDEANTLCEYLQYQRMQILESYVTNVLVENFHRNVQLLQQRYESKLRNKGKGTTGSITVPKSNPNSNHPSYQGSGGGGVSFLYSQDNDSQLSQRDPSMTPTLHDGNGEGTYDDVPDTEEDLQDTLAMMQKDHELQVRDLYTYYGRNTSTGLPGFLPPVSDTKNDNGKKNNKNDEAPELPINIKIRLDALSFRAVPYVIARLIDTSTVQRIVRSGDESIDSIKKDRNSNHRSHINDNSGTRITVPSCADITLWKVTEEEAQHYEEGRVYLFRNLSVGDSSTNHSGSNNSYGNSEYDSIYQNCRTQDSSLWSLRPYMNSMIKDDASTRNDDATLRKGVEVTWTIPLSIPLRLSKVKETVITDTGVVYRSLGGSSLTSTNIHPHPLSLVFPDPSFSLSTEQLTNIQLLAAGYVPRDRIVMQQSNTAAIAQWYFIMYAQQYLQGYIRNSPSLSSSPPLPTLPDSIHVSSFHHRQDTPTETNNNIPPESQTRSGKRSKTAKGTGGKVSVSEAVMPSDDASVSNIVPSVSSSSSSVTTRRSRRLGIRVNDTSMETNDNMNGGSQVSLNASLSPTKVEHEFTVNGTESTNTTSTRKGKRTRKSIVSSSPGSNDVSIVQSSVLSATVDQNKPFGNHHPSTALPSIVFPNPSVLPRCSPATDIDIQGCIIFISTIRLPNDNPSHPSVQLSLLQQYPMATNQPYVWDIYLIDESRSVGCITVQGPLSLRANLVKDIYNPYLPGSTNNTTTSSNGHNNNNSNTTLSSVSLAPIKVGNLVTLRNIRYRYYDRVPSYYRMRWTERSTVTKTIIPIDLMTYLDDDGNGTTSSSTISSVVTPLIDPRKQQLYGKYLPLYSSLLTWFNGSNTIPVPMTTNTYVTNTTVPTDTLSSSSFFVRTMFHLYNHVQEQYSSRTTDEPVYGTTNNRGTLEIDRSENNKEWLRSVITVLQNRYGIVPENTSSSSSISSSAMVTET